MSLPIASLEFVTAQHGEFLLVWKGNARNPNITDGAGIALKWPTNQQLAASIEAAGIRKDGNDGQFLQRVFSGGPQRYVRRLRRLGFEGRSSVLDAGSGFGQWSIILAQLNHQVFAFDTDPQRVAVLDFLLKELEITNVTTAVCKLPAIPPNYPMFDGVFCFGTIFLSPWKTSIRNLATALETGGLIYLNANDLGWYLRLYETNWNEAGDYMPRDYLAASLKKTSTYNEKGIVEPVRGHIIITRAELRNELEAIGFSFIRQGLDGAVSSSFAARRFRITRFFPGTYKSFDSVHEILAKQ